jgi:hypothetical protein
MVNKTIFMNKNNIIFYSKKRKKCCIVRVAYIDYTLAYWGRFSSGGDDGRSDDSGDDGRSDDSGDDGRSDGDGDDGGLNVRMHCWLEQAQWLLELMQLSLQVCL